MGPDGRGLIKGRRTNLKESPQASFLWLGFLKASDLVVRDRKMGTEKLD